MANVITQNQRTFYLEAFIERFTVTGDSFYLGIGRSASWPNDNLPPTPQNTIDERTNFFTDLLAVQRVNTIDIAPVVRRIDWTSGTEYDLFDNTSDMSFDSNFYVLNSENRVYIITAKVASSVSTVEPTGTNASIVTGDGYTWKYLFNLESSILPLLTNTWIPVPFKSQVTAEQTANGDEDAYITLGANHAIVRSEVSDPSISDSITYRQIALLSRITDNSDILITANAEDAANVKDSGLLLTIENRVPTTRSTGQNEAFLTIFKVY